MQTQRRAFAGQREVLVAWKRESFDGYVEECAVLHLEHEFCKSVVRVLGHLFDNVEVRKNADMPYRRLLGGRRFKLVLSVCEPLTE